MVGECQSLIYLWASDLEPAIMLVFISNLDLCMCCILSTRGMLKPMLCGTQVQYMCHSKLSTSNEIELSGLLASCVCVCVSDLRFIYISHFYIIRIYSRYTGIYGIVVYMFQGIFTTLG